MKNESLEKLSVNLNNILNDKKEKNLDQVVKKAVAHEVILKEILRGLKSKNETFRYNCYKVIFQISKAQPMLLFPQWKFFLGLLSSPNAYHRMSAINIVSYLIHADTEKKFDLIFDWYFQYLDDKSMIVARYLAINSAEIANAKPYLQEKIATKLLDIDSTHHEEGRKELIKHDIIQSLSMFFSGIHQKKRIFSFVDRQLNSSSPKTRKAAKDFLKRFGKEKN